MPRQKHKYELIWTNNQSQPIPVTDFRDIVLTIVGTGVAGVLGSCDYDPAGVIDFTSPSTINNSYAGIIIADLGIANTYSLTLTAAGNTKIGEVNTNLLTWICITRTANTLDGFVTVCDNS